ncbi:HNH endonuclease [Mycobacterium sp. 050134]|uniref:HNH endonuclease n=1 Tax=Mycobacterium sp. 050134 TaxID=3096111 RepID=UPI002ED860D5
MRALGIAAAAAIAFAPFSLVATTPFVAHATPFPDAGADPKGCQRFPFLLPQNRVRIGPALPEAGGDRNAGADPTDPSAKSSSPEHAPRRAADEEPTPPWWRSVLLRYGVLVTSASLIAWGLGLSSHHSTGTPPIPSRSRSRRAGPGALTVKSALAPTFPTIDHPDSAVKRRVLVEAGHRCAIPTCRNPTTEMTHIPPESQSQNDSFENLIALCPDCQKKENDPQSIRMHKRNLGILNSRYSDFERRVFDQIAETDQRSFIVEAGLEIPLLHAVNDGLLKRIELSTKAIHRGQPTHYKYEVADAGLNFVSRYIQGEDIS